MFKETGKQHVRELTFFSISQLGKHNKRTQYIYF